MKSKCMFWLIDRCNSDYGKQCVCDGKNPPEECPYKFLKELASKNKASEVRE